MLRTHIRLILLEAQLHIQYRVSGKAGVDMNLSLHCGRRNCTPFDMIKQLFLPYMVKSAGQQLRKLTKMSEFGLDT